MCSLVAFQISSEIFTLLFHLIVSALFYSSVEPSESAGDVWWTCRSYQYLAVSSWSSTGWDWKKTSKQAGGNREGRQPLVSQGWYAVVCSPVLSVMWGFSWSSFLSICRDGRNSDGRGFSVTGSSSGWWRWNFFLTTTDVYFKYLESIVSITPMFVFDFSLEIISLSLSLLFLFPSAFVVWAGWRQPPGWECSWTSHHLDELPWKCQRGTRRTQISWAEQKLWEGVPAHQKCPSEYLHFYRIPFSPWVGHFVPTY